MATSNLNPVAAANIGLEDSKFTAFDTQALVDGDTKAINTMGFFFETNESAVGDIEALIVEDLKQHPVEAIDHILVSPEYACLLFLDGQIGREHIHDAVENGNEIKLSNVKFTADGEERGFKVIIRNGYKGYATMNKVGEVL